MTSPCFLSSRDKESVSDIDIDSLYDKQHQRNLKQMAMYNKILKRVQVRITATSKMRVHDKRIKYLVPPFIINEPWYIMDECITYITANLEDNGFDVLHRIPNVLIISWDNWVPSYVRDEYKKNTGKKIDCHGNLIADPINMNEETKTGSKHNYISTDTYKPSGNFVYNPDILEKKEKKVERKVSFDM